MHYTWDGVERSSLSSDETATGAAMDTVDKEKALQKAELGNQSITGVKYVYLYLPTCISYVASPQAASVNSERTRRWKSFKLNWGVFRELGFIASFIQAWAATIFWISGYATTCSSFYLNLTESIPNMHRFTGLPEIQSSIASKTSLQNGVFWTPQVIGGSGFVISAYAKFSDVSATSDAFSRL